MLRAALAPLFALAALLCMALGSVVIFFHIRRHAEPLSDALSSVQPALSPFDGVLFFFMGILCAASAILFYEARTFRRLSAMLRQFSRSRLSAAIFGMPTPKWSSGAARPGPKSHRLRAARRPFVFLSYAHTDSEWRNGVKKWLEPSLRSEGWELWSDERLDPGYSWNENLGWAIENSSMAVCLVSQDFVASPFISSQELPALRQRPQYSRFGLDWIPLRLATVKAIQLDENQALWSPEKPLANLTDDLCSKALMEITEKVLMKISMSQVGPPDPPKPS